MVGSDSMPGSGIGIPGLEDLHAIGSGGFATVYRARQPQFARDVAVKVIDASGLDDTGKARFERECQALGRLSSRPGIVTVYQAGFAEAGQPYLVMEYFPQGSLADRIETSGPLPWSDVANIGADLAAALAAAHRHDIIHRDIKPANVFVGDDGQVALGDFGIARIAGAAETRSGVVTASLAHAPPEVLNNQRPTAKSDIYSLGSTLFELLNGSPAFLDETDEVLASMLSRIAQSPVPDLRLRGVPNGLADTIERAMAKDPAQRWDDAEAMADALRSVASDRRDETVEVKREILPPLPSAPPDRRHRRTLLAVLAGVAIAGLVISAVAAMRDDDSAGRTVAAGPSTAPTTGPASTSSTPTTLLASVAPTATSPPVDPNSVEFYYTTDGTRPALAPSCLGLLSLCLRQPVSAATDAFGAEDELTDFGGGDVFHAWNLTPEVRFSVIADSIGSITSMTLAQAAIDGNGFRAFAPEGGLFGEITMGAVKGQYGPLPTEETLPGEGFILYSYSYRRGPEGTVTLDFTHAAPFDNDPGGFTSDLEGRLVTSVTVAAD